MSPAKQRNGGLPDLDDEDDEALRRRLAPAVQALPGFKATDTASVPKDPTSDARRQPEPPAPPPQPTPTQSTLVSPSTAAAGSQQATQSSPPIVPLPPSRDPAAPSLPEKRPRQGVEFNLPAEVVLAMKRRALDRGISTTALLLEHLRDLGYPVIESDFVDLRKLPRR